MRPLPSGEGCGEAAAAGGASHASPPQPNNFDLLRLAAALLVLFSHAFVLTGHPEDEPVAILLQHVTDGGGLAVGAFFVLSGFLIANSAERHPWRHYLRARALRIYPAFAALILAQTLLLGAAVSSLGPAHYLATPSSWTALARALVFSPPPGLPGVFETNTLPGIVNGSLWTLRIEVLCYAATLAWALLGARRWMVALAVLAGFAALAAAHAAGAGLRIVSVLDCLLFFATGTALWSWRERIPLRWWGAAALLALFAAGSATPAAQYLWHLALPYLVLRLGLSRPVLAGFMRRLGDISYGAYLYAFPVQQTLVSFVPGLHPLGLAALATPVTLLLALASRRLIELPALSLKRSNA